MTTTVYVNKDGLNFASPIAIIYEGYSQNTSSGYAYYPDFTEQWSGANLTYSSGYLLPTSGILTSLVMMKPNSDIIYAIYCNYLIKAADSLSPGSLVMAAVIADSKEVVQWYGGSGDDKFYFVISSNINGGDGIDSLHTYNPFSSYSFSNFDVLTSSMTITNVAKNTSAKLTSIENIVFTDRSLSFSEIAASFNRSAPAVNHAPTGNITISGNPIQEQILTSINTLADADGLGIVSYQWLKNNLPINGATQANYTLTASDVGRSISVTASYTDGLKNVENVTSTGTDLVDTATPTYSLTASKSNVDEGMVVTFNLVTTNLPQNSQVPFSFSGDITNDDIVGGLPESSFVVGADGKTSLSLKLANDKKNEGNETLALTLNNDDSQTVKVVVKDTSVTTKVSTVSSSGNDVLTGTSKADTLFGGLGADTLTGGAGADIFKFNNVKETGTDVKTRDTIVDFKTSEGDKIDLSGIDANISKVGHQAFSIFNTGEKFSGIFTRTNALFFETSTHILYGNVDTKSGADFSIQLNGVSNLSASDFVL